MDSRLSIPTDNIFKFYALSGLVFCLGALTLFVFTYNLHYEKTVYLSLELAKLDIAKLDNAYVEKQREIIKTQLEIGIANKEFYMAVISFLFSLGIVVMSFGFARWHYKVQPQLDRLVALEIEMKEKELSERKYIYKPFKVRKHDD